MSQSLFPILSSSDLERSLRFYRDLLGGRVEYQFPPDGAPQYVSLAIGNSKLGIGFESAKIEGQQRISLWLYVDDIDATFAALTTAGTTVVAEPTDQAWGERTATLTDPDGNTLLIASPSS